MYSKRVVIANKTGIHARPAGMLAQTALKYPCKITVRNITKNGEAVSAKSLMRIMGTGLEKESVAEISASGEKEREAVETLASLVNSKFGE